MSRIRLIWARIRGGIRLHNTPEAKTVHTNCYFTSHLCSDPPYYQTVISISEMYIWTRTYRCFWTCCQSKSFFSLLQVPLLNALMSHHSDSMTVWGPPGAWWALGGQVVDTRARPPPCRTSVGPVRMLDPPTGPRLSPWPEPRLPLLQNRQGEWKLYGSVYCDSMMTFVISHECFSSSVSHFG